MGKAEKNNEGMPGISPQTEASKLLEQALLQMDGIISGNNSSLTAHSPDYGFASSPPGVREAANSLVTCLQITPTPPPPEPAVARALWSWLQQAMEETEDDEVTFLLKLRPSPTPPTRKRRSGGWDVSIERNVVPPVVPPRKSSVTYVKSHQVQLQTPPPQPSAPPQEFAEAANWSHYQHMPYMGYSISFPDLYYPQSPMLPRRSYTEEFSYPPPQAAFSSPDTRNSSPDRASGISGILVQPSASPPLSPVQGKPPKPLPRLSLVRRKELEVSQQPLLGKAQSELALNFGMDDSSNEEEDTCSSSSETTDSDEHVVNEGLLETITEEDQDRITGSSVHSSEGGDSSPDDESTIKGNAVWSGSGSNRESTSDLSTSSSEHPRSLRDSSTRCNSDFQWIPKEHAKPLPKMEEQIVQSKPPISRATGRDKTPKREKSAPGSLDRRRHHHVNRQEREQKSKSTHVLKSPPRLEDYLPPNVCQNWCCSPHPDPVCFENFHRRHERIDPQRYGSSPMLMEQQRYGSERGSHPDIYGDCNRYRHDGPMGCCSYHMAPPCCFFSDSRNYHWPTSYPSKAPEHDERCRKLQTERDNLQLQVQVLTEQIEAQGDKITDLEKALSEKKQQLASAEDMLQREMLSRSSLETQKLELLSVMSELKLQQAALERENLELRSGHFTNNTSVEGVKKPVLLPRMSPQPQHTSTPVHVTPNQAANLRMSPSPSPLISGSLSSSNSPRRTETSQQEVQQPKTPPATYRRQIDIHYGSLPRQQFISNGTSVQAVDSNANPSGRKGVAFGRGFTTLLGGRARGHSVPNLAESEKIVIDDSTDSTQSPTLQFNKSKGIKKILGKMKRSGSGNLDELPGIGDFQRGGVRATAAARLGWSEPQLTPKPDKPFAEWDTENICDWLQDLGLDQYIPEAKKWVKSGQQLQETSINEIEKELGIKNPLHRKKLQLALIDTQENGSSDPYLSKAGKLDTSWVLRWLDDTGLPQHKENFLINRVDGRVLHRLTMDDLALLHVTSLLHVASLKRGIQVLRENDYEAGCLQRRSLPDDPTQPTSKQICLWTTHRVMEWLRAVDLAEYAPNLRGAGVHGGLMVLEPKFTAELLATLLSIPPGKTLLRRHLNTHFKELLGKEIIQEKREAESTLGYIPLTPSAKLKVAKKAQFSLKRKKSKGEADYGDLVCPMNPSQSGELNGSALSNCVGMMKVDEVKEEDASLLADDTSSGSLPQSLANSPLPQRR